LLRALNKEERRKKKKEKDDNKGDERKIISKVLNIMYVFKFFLYLANKI
jgi:hypothetical protein